jgi:hypothetical protein
VGQFPFGSTQSGCWTPQGVVDLLLELGVRVDFVRHRAPPASSAMRFRNGWVKAHSCVRDGATFTPERTRGTFRTLAVSVRALRHFNLDSF